MPIFEYHAVDDSQATLIGRIEAADEEAARTQLAARGLKLSELREVPALETANNPANNPASGPAVVPAAEALELAVHLADLTSAQLPLAPGLRALALDLPQGRLARAMQRLSAHLQQGMALEAAVNMPDVRLPAHVRGLLACGLRSGQPALVLEQFLDHQRMAGELRRRLWSVISYPLILLVLLFAWCLFVFGVLLPDIRNIFTDFSFTLPNVSLSLVWIADHGAVALGWLAGGVALILGLVRIFGGRHSLSTLMAEVPLIGQVWRDRGLAEFASLLGLLLEHATPLPTALQLTALGISDGALADACQRSAKFAAAGHRLADSIARTGHFPASLTPILAWGDRASAQPEALRAAAEMFRTRTELRSQFLAVIMPPLILVLIGLTMLYVIFGMFAPMLGLLQAFIH